MHIKRKTQHEETSDIKAANKAHQVESYHTQGGPKKNGLFSDFITL